MRNARRGRARSPRRPEECLLSTPGWNCLKTSSLKLSVFSLSWGAFFGSTRAASILPSRPPNLGAAARRACQGWPRLRGHPQGLGLDWPEHGGILDRIGAGGAHHIIGKFIPFGLGEIHAAGDTGRRCRENSPGGRFWRNNRRQRTG